MSGIISELLKEAGQMVKEGEIIAKIKVIPEMVQLNSAESRVRVAKISLEQIEATYKRDEDLHKQGVISKEDYETSLANYKKAQEEAENAQDALEIIREGISRKSASSSTTQVRSTITGMILDVPIKVGNSVIQSNTFNDGTTIASCAPTGRQKRNEASATEDMVCSITYSFLFPLLISSYNTTTNLVTFRQTFFHFDLDTVRQTDRNSTFLK